MTEQEILELANRSTKENISAEDQASLDEYKDFLLKEGRVFAWDRNTVTIVDLPGNKME